MKSQKAEETLQRKLETDGNDLIHNPKDPGVSTVTFFFR
jgi:hypothetical protein